MKEDFDLSSNVYWKKMVWGLILGIMGAQTAI